MFIFSHILPISKVRWMARGGLAAVVFLASMEMAARVDDFVRYGAPVFATYTPDRLRKIDQDGIQHNVPNSHFEKWRINANGFRGPEVLSSKPANVRRIVCMGTSETFGLYENSGQEWPAQLADLLEEYRRYEVINAAVVGLSFKHYKSYLTKYVLRFDPDTIIVMVNPFTYAAGKFRAEKVRIKKDDTHVRHKKRQVRTLHLANISGDLRLMPKIKQALKQVAPAGLLTNYQAWSMKRQVRNIEKQRLNGQKPSDRVSEQGLAKFREDLESLIQFLLGRNIEVILCSYPVLINKTNVDRYPAIFLDHRRFYIELSLEGIANGAILFNREIQAIATKYDLFFVDTDSAIPKNNDYFGDNVHYKDKGAKQVALQIKQQLVR